MASCFKSITHLLGRTLIWKLLLLGQPHTCCGTHKLLLTCGLRSHKEAVLDFAMLLNQLLKLFVCVSGWKMSHTDELFTGTEWHRNIIVFQLCVVQLCNSLIQLRAILQGHHRWNPNNATDYAVWQQMILTGPRTWHIRHQIQFCSGLGLD